MGTSAAARASLDLMLAAASATSAGRRVGPTGSSPLDTTTATYDGGMSRRNGWRFAFFGASGLLLLLLFVLMVSPKHDAGHIAAAAVPPIGSGGSALPPTAIVLSPPAAEPSAPATASAANNAKETPAAASVEKTPPRPAPVVQLVHPSPPRVWTTPASARSHAAADDDPLSDQQ